RPRGVAEERQLGERRAAECAAQVRHVEHPHVGASEACGGEVRQRHAAVLSAVRGGDEGAVAARPGEDEVAGLVADEHSSERARRWPHSKVTNDPALAEPAATTKPRTATTRLTMCPAYSSGPDVALLSPNTSGQTGCQYNTSVRGGATPEGTWPSAFARPEGG